MPKRAALAELEERVARLERGLANLTQAVELLADDPDTEPNIDLDGNTAPSRAPEADETL